MKYEVLARKWRPRKFSAFVGQEHVTRALINALDQNRIHHALLFTGTRGVGKTTLARIFAKCLNCEAGVSSKPCGQCPACQQIDSGRFLDLIEVDAASKTKVDDTRELLENVQYAPSEGRYKIYIIDEVHMLSSHSFNALLKTLEEPPPHVKFLLATTDPQKLPITILSRCLQFHLKNMRPEEIANYLVHILDIEKISFEKPAINLLANAANGSMRDALSLLDQAIVFGNNQVNTADVKNMLGTIDQSYLLQIMQHLSTANATELFNTIEKFSEQNIDFIQALEDLITLIHQLTLIQVLPEITTIQHEQLDELKHLAKQFTAEDLQLFYQIALIGRRDIMLVPTAKMGFEMVLLRMLAFYPDSTHIKMQPPTTIKTVHEKKSIAPIAENSSWTELLNNLNLTGATHALFSHCTLVSLNNDDAHFLLEPSQAPLLNEKHSERLRNALTEYFKRPIKLKIDIGRAQNLSPAAEHKQQQVTAQNKAEASINNDQNLQAILNTFNATIVPASIKPSETT